MSVSTTRAANIRPNLTVVRSTACHFCDDATEALTAYHHTYDFHVEFVEATSMPGAELVRQHRPGMFPLVLVDGQFFSAGRLPRRKLEKLLEACTPRAGQ